MSTNREIAEVYREDLKNPFYSVQKGTRKRKRDFKKSKPERKLSLSAAVRRFGQTDPSWIWGHLREALIRAGIQ